MTPSGNWDKPYAFHFAQSRTPCSATSPRDYIPVRLSDRLADTTCDISRHGNTLTYRCDSHSVLSAFSASQERPVVSSSMASIGQQPKESSNAALRRPTGNP
jgi:hypothetical protein